MAGPDVPLLMRHRERFEKWSEVLRHELAPNHDLAQQIEDDVSDARKDLGAEIVPVARDAIRTMSLQARRHFIQRCIHRVDQQLRPAELAEIDFGFMADDRLRSIAERTRAELMVAYATRSTIMTAVLAGAALEATLLDIVLRHPDDWPNVAGLPKGRALKEWSLQHLIIAACGVDTRVNRIRKLSETIQNYRNLVHPAAEYSQPTRVDFDEAERAVRILGMICRDLAEH
jgi:hypothetical protein